MPKGIVSKTRARYSSCVNGMRRVSGGDQTIKLKQSMVDAKHLSTGRAVLTDDSGNIVDFAVSFKALDDKVKSQILARKIAEQFGMI